MPLFGNRKRFENFERSGGNCCSAVDVKSDHKMVAVDARTVANHLLVPCDNRNPSSLLVTDDCVRRKKKSNENGSSSFSGRGSSNSNSNNNNDNDSLHQFRGKSISATSLKSICASISMLTSSAVAAAHTNQSQIADMPTAAAMAADTVTRCNRTIVTTENSDKPKLVFHCQQAQGGPTGIISGFSNVKELYEKIAECFDFTADKILFCTLNTHKVDTNRLLGGQIGLDDFIFVHRKGQTKEIEIEKLDDALGLTITDNGAGYAFIKRIKQGSLIDRVQHVRVGDHIEKINGESVVGRRHFEVAQRLKDIAKNSIFTLRLVEPLKANDFSNTKPLPNRHSDAGNEKISGGSAAATTTATTTVTERDYGSGTETLRFKANGSVRIEKAPNDIFQKGIEGINRLLENFLGINDDELAARIWETAEGKANSVQFAEAVDNCDLDEFAFSDDFVIELWGVITDARADRRSSSAHFSIASPAWAPTDEQLRWRFICPRHPNE